MKLQEPERFNTWHLDALSLFVQQHAKFLFYFLPLFISLPSHSCFVDLQALISDWVFEMPHSFFFLFLFSRISTRSPLLFLNPNNSQHTFFSFSHFCSHFHSKITEHAFSFFPLLDLVVVFSFPSLTFSIFIWIIFLLFFTLHVQKHKERDRHKPKHKKSAMDMSPSLVLPNIMGPEKVRAHCTLSFTPLFLHLLSFLCLSACFSQAPLFSSLPPFFPDVFMVPVLPFTLKAHLHPPFSSSSSSPTIAEVREELSTLYQHPHRRDWTTTPPGSPTPTFRKCLPLTLAAIAIPRMV